MTAPLRLAVPDLISNSYFPALAAAELGFFAREGLDVAVEMIFPVSRAYEALRDGRIDFVGGAAHAALSAFPQWHGVKLLCAQSQGMYWFLVMHADRGARRGDLGALRNSRIGAAPWVEMGLRGVLRAAGLDPVRDRIEIVAVPPASDGSMNFGLNAARALEARMIDGFWANGMGAEIAVRRRCGTVVLDVRRGDGPAGCFHYTMATIAAADRLIEQSPQTAAAAIRAIVKTQRALKQDVSLATAVGEKLFPPAEAALIAGLVEKDLPYYEPSISRAFVTGMNDFARDTGILHGDVPYESVAETRLPLSGPDPTP